MTDLSRVSDISNVATTAVFLYGLSDARLAISQLSISETKIWKSCKVFKPDVQTLAHTPVATGDIPTSMKDTGKEGQKPRQSRTYTSCGKSPRRRALA
jgi:hypothetical protein